MKNYIQPGDTITAPAPTGGTVSGSAYLLGRLFGVATTTQAVGEACAFKTTGVFEFPKVSAQAWAIGAAIYWDDTAKNMTTTAGSNAYVGVAAEAAANPSAVGRVRLNGALTAA